MKHACHGRWPFNERYDAQDGYTTLEIAGEKVRVARVVEVPHTMTTSCQYTKTNQNDPKCFGCSHREVPAVDVTEMF